jgi:ubiquitin carboxyl-terminal hydrolase 5/13
MANTSSDTNVRIIIDGLAHLKPPTISQSVHREECTQCFDNQVRPQSTKPHPLPLLGLPFRPPQDDPLGVDVCLTCFNGGCISTERHHAQTHFKKTGHAFALNVRRRARPRPKRVSHAQRSTPPSPFYLTIKRLIRETYRTTGTQSRRRK